MKSIQDAVASLSGSQDIDMNSNPRGLLGCSDNYGVFYVLALFGCLAVLTGAEIFSLHFAVFTESAFGESMSWGFSGFTSLFIQLTSFACFVGALKMKREGKNNALPALLFGMALIVGYESLWIIPHVPEGLSSIGNLTEGGKLFMMGVLYFALVMLCFFEIKLFLQTKVDQSSKMNPYEMTVYKKVVDNMVAQKGYQGLPEMMAASITGTHLATPSGDILSNPKLSTDKRKNGNLKPVKEGN
ncbi:MAG: hypothetical protein AAF655_12540 [Bacteroidota bacterium]